MSLNLPERASLDHLKKLSKEWLAEIRRKTPDARLADAQLAVARQYGFASWRALKAELDRRDEPHVTDFMRACTDGDLEALHVLLQTAPGLATEPLAGGTTALHLAIEHPDALRLLIRHGADPNARDRGDNATALHFAAANGVLESVRTLLDAGGDVHGTGDVHDGDVIGWAARKGNEAVIDLLLARGARHHIFSAIALGDRDLVRRLVEENPSCLSRRRSRFEAGHTPLHAAFAPPDGLGHIAGEPDYAMLALLIELGADLEARDGKGRTPLALAILRGDRRAMQLLRAAGAQEPAPPAQAGADSTAALSALAGSITKAAPSFAVSDMRATVRWYRSIGFTLAESYEDGGELVYARLTFGNAELALGPGGNPGPLGVSLWLFTDRVQELYESLKSRAYGQRGAAGNQNATLADVRFDEDLYSPFYGGRQFSIRDINGLTLVFYQPH